jgi:hypothetical protein
MLFMATHPDEMIEKLRELDARISDLRCEQAVLVNELDKANVAGRDGHRSINDWLSATLDMSGANTAELVYAARRLPRYRPINFRLADGGISFDRAVALMRLADAGADDATITHAGSLDLAGVARLTARRHRVTRRDEQRVFVERYVSVQPTLDESAWRLSGLLPAVDGEILTHTLDRRADELRRLPGGDEHTRTQLRADALIAIARDAGTGDGDGPGGSVTVLVDLDEANETGTEAGSEIAYGPRIGPLALEELLCTGTVRIVGVEDGTPVTTTDATRQIPPAVRHLVARRDAGCTIAGCTSRYRLEPHHITPRCEGGTHDPDNLTTLCWYHHHIAIHRMGMRIDPDSPPGRRTLTRRPSGPDPPRY